MEKKKAGGYIGAYGLCEWWLSTFTDDERDYIDSRYEPMGAPPHSLTHGMWTDAPRLPASMFLNFLSTWFRSKDDVLIRTKLHEKVVELGHSSPNEESGNYAGRHYTTYVQDVEALKKGKRLDEAEYLLLALIEAVEDQYKHDHFGPAPWYYKELAKIYHKWKDYASEISILQRYLDAGGFNKPIIREMLEKAKRMKAKNESHLSVSEVK